MAHHQAHEHLLAALLESAEEAVISLSLQGVVETWSPGAERLYGYAAVEMIGQSVSRLLPRYELPQMERFSSPSSRSECKSVEVEERLHKNGSRILLAIRRNPIRGKNGQPQVILEMTQALNPHEAVWLPEEAPLRLLMEQVPGLLWITDRNLKISGHWGIGLPGAKLPPGSRVGPDVREFLCAADPQSTPLAQHYCALRGEVSHFEYTWKSCVLEIRTGPLRSAIGEIIGCLGAAVDITEEKKKQGTSYLSSSPRWLDGAGKLPRIYGPAGSRGSPRRTQPSLVLHSCFWISMNSSASMTCRVIWRETARCAALRQL